MSTRIEDLPGPIPEEVIGNLQDIQNNIRQQQREEELLRQNTLQNSQPISSPSPNPEVYKQEQLNSNVHMNIKKRVKFQDEIDDTDEDNVDLMSFIKNQISEENLLLLIVLVLSSRSDLDVYLKNIPMIGVYASSSDFVSTIVRCIILLIAYLLIRQYILPKIKV
jgi:hypothetical protein